MEIKKAAFLVRTGADVWDCVRSAVGLAVENIEVGVFILGTQVELHDDPDLFLDRLEMIDDLEGRVFTTVAAEAEKYELMSFLEATEAPEKILSYDLVISF